MVLKRNHQNHLGIFPYAYQNVSTFQSIDIYFKEENGECEEVCVYLKIVFPQKEISFSSIFHEFLEIEKYMEMERKSSPRILVKLCQQ